LSLLTITGRLRVSHHDNDLESVALRARGVSLSNPLHLKQQKGATTKTLLTVKGALEAAVGIALLAFPSLVVSVLVGQRINDPAGLAVGRIAGAALLAFGIACWLARTESETRAATGLVIGLLFYDACVVAILLSAHFRSGLTGIGNWPAIALHSGLGVWSVLCLKNAKQWRVSK
jgi:hypothetical protein